MIGSSLRDGSRTGTCDMNVTSGGPEEIRTSIRDGTATYGSLERKLSYLLHKRFQRHL